MKFQKGDLVWIGWDTKDHVVDPLDFDPRLTQGEILEYLGGINDAYVVKLQEDWRPWQISEDYLTKIPPEEHGRHKEKEDKNPAETV